MTCTRAAPTISTPITNAETPVISGKPVFSKASQQSDQEVITVTAVGYGAIPNNDAFSAAQKKLMARRASKLDAARALAEVVQGIKLNGATTVSAMVAQSDGFRVFVDAYLRGARVVSVVALPDGNIETTMEITLDNQFLHYPDEHKPELHGSSAPSLDKNFFY